MRCVITKSVSNLISNVGFICACLVVGLHINLSQSVFVGNPFSIGGWIVKCLRGDGIGNWAVPIFFIISGFLVAGKFPTSQMDTKYSWWLLEVKKRIQSLLVPYVFWNLMYLFFRMTLTSVAAAFSFDFGGGRWGDLSLTRICDALGLNPFGPMELPPLWFVRCLIVFVCVLPVFLLFRKRISWIIVVLLFLVYLYLPTWLPPTSDWKINFYKICWVRGLVFYSLGIWVRFNSDCFATCWNKFLSTWGNFIGVKKWMLFLFRPWPKWLIGSAFPMFLIHPFVLTILIAFFKLIGVKELMENSWWSWWLQMVVTLAACIVFTVLFRRVFPRCSALCFGGR